MSRPVTPHPGQGDFTGEIGLADEAVSLYRLDTESPPKFPLTVDVYIC